MGRRAGGAGAGGGGGGGADRDTNLPEELRDPRREPEGSASVDGFGRSTTPVRFQASDQLNSSWGLQGNGTDTSGGTSGRVPSPAPPTQTRGRVSGAVPVVVLRCQSELCGADPELTRGPVATSWAHHQSSPEGVWGGEGWGGSWNPKVQKFVYQKQPKSIFPFVKFHFLPR